MRGEDVQFREFSILAKNEKLTLVWTDVALFETMTSDRTYQGDINNPDPHTG